jgi:hypothetical protein
MSSKYTSKLNIRRNQRTTSVDDEGKQHTPTQSGDETMVDGRTTLTYENKVAGEKAKILVSVKIKHAPLPYKASEQKKQ